MSLFCSCDKAKMQPFEIEKGTVMTNYGLRKFFEKNRNVSKEGYVSLGLVSKNIMYQVSEILVLLGIKHSIYELKDKRPNCNTRFCVRISKKSNEDFFKKIGLSNPRKRSRLEKSVSASAGGRISGFHAKT